MDLDTELARELERAIPHLPTAPASALLTAGRRARRRRNAFAGVAAVAVLALGTGAAVSALSGSDPNGADGTHVADTPSAGVGAIPEWAQEYGNHGPVSIYPDGRLWVAPDARLIRSVENPLDTDDDDVVSSYAAEAEMDGEVEWSFVYRTSDGVFGQMDDPGRWTNDFDVWIADQTADLEHRPSLAERLVQFADDDSERLVAGPGAVVVDQNPDVVLPNWQRHPRIAVAQVTFEGRTWFVLAMGPAHDKPFYSAFEGSVVQAATLEGFLDWLRDDRIDK
jgi:hypothetical protein